MNHKKMLNYIRNIQCPDCHGHGTSFEGQRPDVKCPYCRGTGFMLEHDLEDLVDAPSCQGDDHECRWLYELMNDKNKPEMHCLNAHKGYKDFCDHLIHGDMCELFQQRAKHDYL